MLTLSYAEALADPTYCEAGHRHGKKLTRTMGVKPNEPRPLKDIFPYCTVPEFLWCLRAVRKSQRAEANMLCLKYIADVQQRMVDHKWGHKITTVQEGLHSKAFELLQQDAKLKEAELNLSQSAIDISNLALKYFSDNPKAEERAQRAKLEELINGA